MPRRPRHATAATTADREVVKPHPGPQTDFLSTTADIAVYGGAMGGGKTYGLLMEAMRHSDVPEYRATIFRRTLKQIEKQGSLWDSSEELYPRTGAHPNLNRKTWTWPSGAQVQLAGLEFEKSIENYLGAQIDMIGFDELVSFSRRQFVWLMSRNRGRSGVQAYVRATTNPDADSWVAKLLEWYINQDTGYPITRRSGKIRWLVVVNDKLFWGDTRQELIDTHGQDALPKSFTFIPAKLDDNPTLVQKNPGYRASLKMQSAVDRLRNEEGNWKVRANAGKVFSRFWFKEAQLPTGGIDCRFWDLAGTKPQQDKDDPDYSAAPVCRKVGAAYFFYGCVAVQEAPAEVEDLMERTARADARRAREQGTQYRMRFEREPGSASVRDAARIYAKFSGLDVRGITPREQANEKAGKWDKVARASAFAAQARAGNVYVCKDQWLQGDGCIDPDQFLSELHGFPDRPHDDVCLHGDTLVACKDGARKIRDVAAGDLVWTRAGLRRVLWSGMTNPSARLARLASSSGRFVLGTGSHPVWTEGRGFIRLDAASGYDKILECQNHPRPSSTGAGPTGDTPTLPTDTCASTTGATTSGPIRRALYTGTSGPTATARYRAGMRFTTPTGIHSTTGSRIFSALRCRNTVGWRGCETRPSCPTITSEGFVPPPRRGTDHPRGWSGTADTPGSFALAKGNIGTFVVTVGGNSGRPVRPPNTVPTIPETTEPPRIGGRDSWCANFADRRSRAPEEPVLAPASVVHVCDTGTFAPVYNLTVDGESEFFANGILVHNCDAASGCFNSLPNFMVGGTETDNPFTVGPSMTPGNWGQW